MSIRALIAAIVCVAVCPAVPVFADDSGTDCKKANSSPLPTSMSWDALLSKLKSLDGPGAHLIDAYFMFDVRTKDKALDITASSYDSTKDPGGTRGATAIGLYFAWKAPTISVFGATNPPQNSDQYLALLRANAGSLDLHSKFLLLSLIGGGLNGCYNSTNAPYTGTSHNRIFTSLRAGTNDCGVCHDIHSYMATVAQALGFVDTGTHTANWSDAGGPPGSHDIMHMRDPKTGLYYVQNYGTTFGTGQNTLTQAIDVSVATLGRISGISLVESKPGVVHEYQPLVTRWARQTIEDAAKLGADRSMITMHIGNREQNFRIELGAENTKVFALHDNYETSNGPYTIDAVGVAGQINGKKELQARWLSEVGYAANIYGGAMRISAPYLGSYNAGDGATGSTVTGFAGFNVNGYARWNAVTAKFELHGDMMDYTPQKSSGGAIGFQLPPNNALKASIVYAPKGLPVSVEATRAWKLSVGSIPVQNPVLRTDYDKINLVIDTRDGKNTPYIVNTTGVYLFEGMENTSAVGIKEHFKAVIPTKNLGEFYAIFDASTIVANRANDPFYEAPLALTFGTGWTKKIYKSLNVGADFSASTSQKPFYLFEEPGTVTPEMGKTDGPRIIGNVWLGGKF